MIGDETQALRDAFDGPVHGQGDDGYDAARRPWQLKVDPRPALVVEAVGPGDVQAAIRTAREAELPFAVQSTGHGAVQRADGGILLKTSAMDGVAVDPERRVARVDAGTTWSSVIAAAAPHGLAPLSGSSPTVGVVGYTLGGGVGWLCRKYGYAADSVLSAKVVTADGELVTASRDEHPDLFWALRGGGGNFGVVTELEFRLYPVESVYGGMAMFDVDRAVDALAVYREWAVDEPDESNTSLVAMTVPPAPMFPEAVRGRRVLMLRALYIGSPEDAERTLAPLRQAAGEPLFDAFREMSYPETATLGPPPMPMATAMRIELFEELSDEVIQLGLGANGLVAGVEFHHWGGAPARPDRDAGPVGHRGAPFSVVAAAMAEDGAQGPALQAAVDKVGDRLAQHSTGGSFLNFLGDASQTASAYTTEDYERLSAVKREYDPGNFFSSNLNIPPAG
jgi:UDP-N-acetylenolpyruvoylglucosamine reductase